MEAEATARPERRSFPWRPIAKALFTIGFVAVLLVKVPIAQLGARLAQIGAGDLALLAIAVTLQVTLGVVRWWRLMARAGARVPFFALYADTLVGIAYNLFLPTTVGGDVVRAWRAARRTLPGSGHAAWSTSLFERLAGLLAMALTGAAAALLAVGSALAVPPAVRAATLVLALALFFAFVLASKPVRWAARLLERRVPAAAARDLAGVAADLEGPLATMGARLEALGWSIAYQAAGVLFVIVGARAMGASGHELGIAVGMPLVHILSMLPITLGGHGLREGLFVAVLGQVGIASDVALALGAQWLASNVLFAMLGALVAIATKAPRR